MAGKGKGSHAGLSPALTAQLCAALPVLPILVYNALGLRGVVGSVEDGTLFLFVVPLPLFLHSWLPGSRVSWLQRVLSLTLLGLLAGIFFSGSGRVLSYLLVENLGKLAVAAIMLLHLYSVLYCVRRLVPDVPARRSWPESSQPEGVRARMLLLRLFAWASFLLLWAGLWTGILSGTPFISPFLMLRKLWLWLSTRLNGLLIGLLPAGVWQGLRLGIKLLSLDALIVSVAAYLISAYTHWLRDDNRPLKKRALLREDCFEILWQAKTRLGDGCGFGFLSQLAYRLGSIQINWWLSLPLRLPYLCLWLLSLAELLLRRTIGLCADVCLFLLHRALCLAWALLCLLLRRADALLRARQNCPECKRRVDLPTYLCPGCGEAHEKLLPGDYGVLRARCACGERLPCTVLSRRTDLSACCPTCGAALSSGGVPHFDIQVIGADDRAVSAFLAGLQHQLTTSLRCKLRLSPPGRFARLEELYARGRPAPTADDNAGKYSVLLQKDGRDDYELALYDISAQALREERYSTQQLQLAYCNAVVLVLSPAALCEAPGEDRFAVDDINDSIDGFINEFKKLTGLHPQRRTGVPLAVVLNGPGLFRLQTDFSRQQVTALAASRYGGDARRAMDELCVQYLAERGLAEAVGELATLFSTIHYYPVSLTGRSRGVGLAPVNVLESVAWLLPRQLRQALEIGNDHA